jgi:Tol biopolymer transport system component
MRRETFSLVALAGICLAALAQARPEASLGRIVYSRWTGEAIGIHLADGAFKEDQRGPSLRGREQVHPTLSRDGKRLAFASPNGLNPNDFDLFVVNVDGSGLRQLVADAALPAWSPDGTRLLYAATNVPPGVGIVNADGTGAHALPLRKLLSVAPFWSPDGTRIAFTASERPDPKTADVFLANPDGTGIERLTNGQRLYLGGAGAWSPDGKQIVLFAADLNTKKGELQIWDVEKKQPRRVADVVNALQTKEFRLGAANALQMACWSPDGRALLVTMTGFKQNRADVGLYLLSPEGTILRRLTPEGVLCFNGNWIP